MTLHDNVPRRNFAPPSCVICNGKMRVKEIRRHNDPTFEVCFLKCGECGLERPMVVERE